MNSHELFYYQVAILSSASEPFAYSYNREISTHNIVLVELRNRECKGVIYKKIDKPTFECKPILLVYEEYIKKDYFSIAIFIQMYYVCKLGEALSIFYPFKEFEKNIDNEKLHCDILLSTEQKKAYTFAKNNKQSLIFGDTGSGKTEIYISLVIDVLNKNKNAIILIPEISLTPQLSKRLKKYFKDKLGIWHSKITSRAKQEILQGIHSQKIRVVAGTRSALFLPFTNLELIVVDEEHDSSYKSSKNPRVNIKDLAIYISKKLNISLVLGSATPSLNSYQKINIFRLKGRFFESEKKFYFDNTISNISTLCLAKIDDKLKKNEQIIIFLPTRANFKYLVCDSCGESLKCPFCDVGMSLHTKFKILKCHYCNYKQQIESNCKKCNNGLLINKRVGTSEICDILNASFPNSNITKFDKDEITTNSKLKSVLRDFNSNKIDILVGTQMLSKGHDYHNVSLAIILDIDYILNSSSFRAREDALSLLIQISGRCGRKQHGEVIVQTVNEPFFSSYIDDYEFFIKEELKMRTPIYPPYKKIANIIFAHKKQDMANYYMNECLDKIKDKKDLEIVGYGESPISKIASKYRFHIFVRSSSSESLLKIMHFINDENTIIDVDPISIY
jgi:primosomal protein N' (replication factor Y)